MNRRMTACLMLAGVLAGCGSGSKAADAPTTLATLAATTTTPTTEAATTTTIPHHDLAVTFTLTSSSVAGRENDCTGTNGYNDFAPGMNVAVKDGNGNIVGAGSLGPDLAHGKGWVARRCILVGTVSVAEAEFYVVTIGKRGDQTYTKAQMEDRGYKLDLSLG